MGGETVGSLHASCLTHTNFTLPAGKHRDEDDRTQKGHNGNLNGKDETQEGHTWNGSL